MRPLLTALLVSALITPASAALVADINVDRLREAPEAEMVRARLDTVMPHAIQERLAHMAAAFNCDPRKDIERIVISKPDTGAPTIRIVGLPATAIANALAQRGEGMTVLGGLTGYPLPQRPHAVLVAINDNEMLIGRGDLLRAETQAPPTLPPIDNALTLRLTITPSENPRAEFMTLISSVTVTANGQGHIDINALAHNEADAKELERRMDVIRDMTTIGAEGLIPNSERAKRILDATTMERQDQRLQLHIDVPDDVRQFAIERLLSRVEERAGRRP